MSDLDKLFEKAEKSLQKQKFEAALETYKEIYKHRPADEEVLGNLGDLSLKLNRIADGVRFHSRLVDQYLKRNDKAKAIATCRKILKAAPQEAATLTRLGGLLERSEKNAEALEAYRAAFEVHRMSNDTQQAIECLQRIVDLDPEDLDAYVELGELAARSRQSRIATPAFLEAARLARKAGEEKRWAQLVERALALDPTDEAASIAGSEVFLKTNRAAEVVPLLEPLHQVRPDDATICELLTRSYLGTGNFEKAEPLCWKLYQASPSAIELPVGLVEGLLKHGQASRALAIVERIKGQLFRQNQRDDFLRIVERLYEADESNVPVLKVLAHLYDELNREDGLRRALTRLFNLYVGGEQYEEAATTLEKIVDVEPYGQGHHDRLLALEGHIGRTWYNNILARIPTGMTGRGDSVATAGPGTAAAPQTESLDDLIVEGEMYHQYQLASKLSATLEKIDRLFPGAQDRNKQLRELYDSAGFTPTPSPSTGAAPGSDSRGAGVAGSASAQSLEDLRKISDITARLHHESTPQGVLQLAVNEIGRALNASRCWSALGSADRPPGLAVEYCSPATGPSDSAAAARLYDVLMRHAATSPDGWLIEDAGFSPLLTSALLEVKRLDIKSLLALPLMDHETPAGLLLVEQCDTTSTWKGGESLFLKTVASQIVVAVNNTKLRRLVQSLAGSDQETGLLPRSSYLDCLLAEGSRAKESSQPVSVCLLEIENPNSVVKTLGEKGVQRYFQQASKIVLTNLRQNDISIRYTPLSIAVIFPDTALPQCGLAVEKIRRALGEIKADGVRDLRFCAAVCDIPLGPNFDVVDGVTEAINRLEAALEMARREGGKQVLISKFKG